MHGPVMKLLKKYATPKNIRDYLLVKPDADFILDRERERVLLTLPEGYKRLSDCTDKDYKANLALKYLKSRGITDDIIDEFDIGYTYRGKFFNRVIIPSYDSEGELTYFIARWFDKEYTKLKYLNPDAEKQEIIFNEGKLNLDGTIYIVEGVTDHIVVPNSIPLLGKILSNNLLDLLHDKSAGFIVIVLDDDAWEDAKSLYRQLNFGNLRGRIKLVRPPEGYDPSKIFENFGNVGIVKLLKTAFKPEDKDVY
jgi:DNA primase